MNRKYTRLGGDMTINNNNKICVTEPSLDKLIDHRDSCLFVN